MPHRPTALRRTFGLLARLLLTASLATGCSSTRRMAPGPGGFQQTVRRGDALRIVRSDGRALDVYVVAVTEDGLVAEPDRRDSLRAPLPANGLVAIRWSEVARVDRYGFSPGRTAVAVGAVGLAAAYVAFSAWTARAWTTR